MFVQVVAILLVTGVNGRPVEAQFQWGFIVLSFNR